MKTKTEVYDISHEDLVNLFSTALYGSSYLGCNYHVDLDENDNGAAIGFKESDCFEDKIAKCLLAGKRVAMVDHYCEGSDEFYGSLEHRYDEESGCMLYMLDLDTIKKGLETMLNAGGWNAKYVMMLVNEDYEFDLIAADAIMQNIMFGEEIYG